MSLKAIDGQLSVTRAIEVSSVQNQMHHKPTDDLMAGANLFQKQKEAERKKSNQVDRSAESKIRDGGEQGKKQQELRKNQNNDSEEEPSLSEHPYKGKFIDLSL